MPIRLEQVTPMMAAVYREVRLRALLDIPSAFGSTHAKESQLTEADWLKRATSSDGIHSIVLIAFDAAEPCGIIRCSLEPDLPNAALITAMWVAPSARRTGAGTQLLDAAQQWAATRNATHLLLMVVNSNQAAIAFYQRSGFSMTGNTNPYPNNPNWIEYEMSKPLT